MVLERFATVEQDGVRVENIAYESVPGYWVSANVYVPEGSGPFPAMVIAPGHGAGKARPFAWGASFARGGILTLSIDAMGQGERLQHFDPESGTSKVERRASTSTRTSQHCSSASTSHATGSPTGFAAWITSRKERTWTLMPIG